MGNMVMLTDEVREALKGILVFGVPAPNVQNRQKWDDAVELATEWCANLPQAPEPDWSQAPEWAQWWAVDPDGLPQWFSLEPYFTSGSAGWQPDDDDPFCLNIHLQPDHIDIPLGIDWRTLKQRRPEAPDA